MKSKVMFVTVGIPGCGKTTYCKNLYDIAGGAYISRDEIRFSLVGENEEYFSKENEVWKIFIERIQKAIDDPEIQVICVDATHINLSSRNKLLSNLKLPKEDSNFQFRWLVFPIALETALERNKKREGRAVVPETIIKNMYANLTYPKNNVLIINEQGVCKSE